MTQDPRMYGSGFNPSVTRDLMELNKKIEEEKDPEEIMKLKMQRLYRGMELNAGPISRNYRGMFPY